MQFSFLLNSLLVALGTLLVVYSSVRFLQDSHEIHYTVVSGTVEVCELNQNKAIDGDKLFTIYGKEFSKQYHYPIQAKMEVQQLLDQSFLHLFGYNIIEAKRNILEAIKRDSDCGVCYLVLAYANSPYLNSGISEENVLEGRNAINKAFELMYNEEYKQMYSDVDRGLVDAFRERLAPTVEDWKTNSQRYYDEKFVESMAGLSTKFPKNPEVLAIYADSIMNLTPWHYYEKDQSTLLPGMDKAVNALEKSLKYSNYKQPLALHLYIHIVEQSNRPRLGLKAVNSLVSIVEDEGTSHLHHMPSHIFMRTGEYEKCIKSSKRAIAIDDYYARNCLSTYVPLHNKALLISCALNSGRLNDALEQSFSLFNSNDDLSLYLLGLFPAPKELIFSRFGLWKDVMKLLGHDEISRVQDRELVQSVYHPQRPVFLQVLSQYAFVLSLIHLHSSKSFILQQLDVLSQLTSNIPPDAVPESHVFYPYHREMGQLMNATAQASFFLKFDNNFELAIKIITYAVSLQDSFSYMEPENYYIPLKQCLGALYLHSAKHNSDIYLRQLIKAQELYVQDLDQHPFNGWSLQGYIQVLEHKTSLHKSAAHKLRRLNEFNWNNMTSQELKSLFSNHWAFEIEINGSCCELGYC